MSMGSAPKTASERGACIEKAEQPCNVTDDNLGPDVCTIACMLSREAYFVFTAVLWIHACVQENSHIHEWTSQVTKQVDKGVC